LTCRVCGEPITMGNQGGVLLSGYFLCGECLRTLKLLYKNSEKLGDAMTIGLEKLRDVLDIYGLSHKYDKVVSFLLSFKAGVVPFADMKGKMSGLAIKNEVVDEWMWQVWDSRGLKRVWNDKTRKWEWLPK